MVCAIRIFRIRRILTFALILAATSGLIACDWLRVEDGENFAQWGQYLMQAEVAPVTGPTPPASGWLEADLSKHHLHLNFPEISYNLWLRFRIPESARRDELMAIYLWKVNVNAAVWWNGQALGDGGKMTFPPARNWNRPLYFNVPQGLWRPGDNELLVRLVGWPKLTWMAPPVIGSDRLLRPRFERRTFLQNRIPQVFCFVLAGLAITSFVVWILRQHENQFLYFSAASVLLAMFQSYLFVQNFPFDGAWVQPFAHWCVDMWLICILAFFYKSLGLVIPAARLLAAAAAIFITAVYLLLPLSWIFQTAPAMHAISCLAAALFTVHLFWYGLRHKNPTANVFGAAFGLIVAAGAHDVANLMRGYSYSVDQLIEPYMLFQYSGAIATIAVAIYLIRQFTRTLDENESLNRSLEQRIDAARDELASSFARQQQLETSQAVSEERERIYSDLHDDVGAKLLSLMYNAEDPRNADLARSALEDLRDSVSRVQQGDVPLIAAIDDWHEECSQRFAMSPGSTEAVQLNWEEPDDLGEYQLNQEQRVALGRVLRETISNALRHAQPSQVSVQFSLEKQGLYCRISHNGQIGDVSQWKAGRGLNNMQLRIHRLDGHIQCTQNGDDAVIEWRVPL